MCSIQWSEGGQPNLAFGLVKASVKLWSNSIKLGQTLPNLEKCVPGHVLRVLKCKRNPPRSNQLNLGCLVLRANTRERPGGKNRVMIPILMIFPFELSPNLTFPPSFRASEVNLFLSPDICFEHPLSCNHLSLVDLDIKHTYKTNLSDFLWYPNLLGSTWVSSRWSGSFNNQIIFLFMEHV